MSEIVRIRTIAGCIPEIRKIDPGTSISQNFIRTLVLTRKIKSTKAGSKYLVNFDSLLEYLQNSVVEGQEDQEVTQYGKLRKIQG